jgi:hypothetical protein
LNNIEINKRYGYKYNYGYNYGYGNQEVLTKKNIFKKIKEFFS